MANYTFITGKSPIVFTAIHDGHSIREELNSLFHLTEEERLREEDPFTGEWARVCDNYIIGHQSRFETDFNRAREKAVYLRPEDAWGLKVWKTELEQEVVSSSLAVYDNFYHEARNYFVKLLKKHPRIIVYDIHSYNHRRESEDKIADPEANPEINLGTKNMDHQVWDPLVNTLANHLKSFDFNGRHLDVGENIKFKGGYFGQWLFEQFGSDICPISIEFKKFFMDEWKGKSYDSDIKLIYELLNSSLQPVEETLKELNTQLTG